MSLATDNDVRLLAVAICAMPNPPSWDDALRIAQWLMVQRIVNTPTQETDHE